MRRRAIYILLAALLFVGSAYNTGLRLGLVTVVPDSQVQYRPSKLQHWRVAPESLEKLKPKFKVRYRASEVKPDLCGTDPICLPKHIFATGRVFFDNYSFLTFSYQHAVKLRGPPARYSC